MAHDHDTGFHEHDHLHADGTAHQHPHHHPAEAGVAPHDHAHATSLEALTYLRSPLHQLDARAKLISALVFVLGVVATAPLHTLEFALVAALLLSLGVIGGLPLRRLLLRSAAVLPVAGMIALLAPLQSGGAGVEIAWGIVSKAWISAHTMVLLAASTRTADLLAALRSLRVPDVFVMLLSFIARYVSVIVGQLRSLRLALASRGPRLRSRMLLTSLGSIAGNLVVRSYERGERVHAAMVARGYTGVLPTTTVGHIGVGEVLMVTTALLSAAAVALY
jgi:cobalt/nickel transport system permease protein